jgi:ATP-dependent RNA helicase RhlE
MSFSTLGLSKQVLSNIQTLGFKTTTPIQEEVIPLVLARHDVLASAPTGTGKTATYLLPLIEKIKNDSDDAFKHTKVLIMVPTRELVLQVNEHLQSMIEGCNIKAQMLYGGTKLETNKKALSQSNDIVIATPGRLKELIQNKAIILSRVEYLVLDEADTILDMGFFPDIEKIMAYLPEKRQNLLFSAAFTASVKRLAQSLLKNPQHIDISARAGAKTIDQALYLVDSDKKAALLSYIIGSRNLSQVLVFAKTKERSDLLIKELALDGIKAQSIHGDKTQAARTRALKAFKDEAIRVLVATDIAARGIDINGLACVINYDLPHKPQEYIHRIGRTGRAGLKGEAISLVSTDDDRALKDIERLMQQKIVRLKMEGFEPTEKRVKLSSNGQGLAKKEKVEGAFGHKKKRTGPKSKQLRGKRAIYADKEASAVSATAPVKKSVKKKKRK